MRRHTIILTAKEDEMTGEIGLCIPGLAPSEIVNASLVGDGIAHDLVEHMNGASEIGGIDDELEALGAMWFVRGCTGQLRRDNIGSAYSAERNIASDLSRMFDDHYHGGQYVGPLVRTRAVQDDDSLREIVSYAQESIIKNENGHDIENAAERNKVMARYLAVCLARMRIGYRKARRKYKNTDEANHLFWDIAEAVAPRCKQIDAEGQQFELAYGGDRPATCYEYYPEDNY